MGVLLPCHWGVVSAAPVGPGEDTVAELVAVPKKCGYIHSRACTMSACVTSFRYDMTDEEAIELGKRAIYHATHRDAMSGGINNCKLDFV